MKAGGREWESNPRRTGRRPSLDLKSSRPTGSVSLPCRDFNQLSGRRATLKAEIETPIDTRMSYLRCHRHRHSNVAGPAMRSSPPRQCELERQRRPATALQLEPAAATNAYRVAGVALRPVVA